MCDAVCIAELEDPSTYLTQCQQGLRSLRQLPDPLPPATTHTHTAKTGSFIEDHHSNLGIKLKEKSIY